MTYEFNIDIGAATSNLKRITLLSPTDFALGPGQCPRLVAAFQYSETESLLDICQKENLLYDVLKSIINDSSNLQFDGFMLVVTTSQINKFDHYQALNPVACNLSIMESRETRLDSFARENNLRSIYLIDKNIPIVQLWWINKFGSFTNHRNFEAGDYRVFIRDKNSQPNDWHYRIYLNDRMLIERVMMPGIPLDRKVWQEQLSFSKIPADGFNFRLETSLNIQFDKVDLNGIITQPMDKSFSVNP